MSGVAARVADATGNWVDTRAPMWSRPYLRLARFDRPIGSWLLLLPCWWSAALAAGVAGDLSRLPLVIVLFFVGAFVMRGAGCTWNDITDRDLDAKVERTRSRPIPAGQVSVIKAAVFLVAQALVGLAVLLQFNRFAIATGIASLVIVAIYPFMKRITWWPQIVLGLAFSWGALMGFAVMLGRIDAAALWLYAGSIAWVIGYDTIYAHQDAEDDALIGIKSTALLFGARTRPALVAFYVLAVVLIGAALALSGARWPAAIGLAAFAAHLTWQIVRLDISDPALCQRIFKSNRDAGLLLFAGLLIDAVMRLRGDGRRRPSQPFGLWPLSRDGGSQNIDGGGEQRLRRRCVADLVIGLARANQRVANDGSAVAVLPFEDIERSREINDGVLKTVGLQVNDSEIE
jgi:4-hydroxybenzoate polyprenyltransferase